MEVTWEPLPNFPKRHKKNFFYKKDATNSLGSKKYNLI
jgi:hypothetical protein